MAQSNQHRPEIASRAIDQVHEEIANATSLALNKKGEGIFVSSHECLGVISEEFDEYKQAVRDNSREDQYKELIDIAVSCVVALASMKTDGMDYL